VIQDLPRAPSHTFSYTTRLCFSSTNALKNLMQTNGQKTLNLTIPTLPPQRGGSIVSHVLNSYATNSPFVTMGHPLCAPKIALSRGGLGLQFNTWFLSWTHPTYHPKRHPNRLSHFSTIHGRFQQTDRQKEHGTQPVPIPLNMANYNLYSPNTW